MVPISGVGNDYLVIDLADKVYIGGSIHTSKGTVTWYVSHTFLGTPRVAQGFTRD
jgi:hypothetical protein